MSDYTPQKNEILWANIAPGTQLNTFTTEASLMGGIVIPKIYAGYFDQNDKLGRTLRLRAMLKMGSTTTGPNFTITPRLFVHGTAFSAGGGIALGVFAVVQMAASQTLAPAFMDLDIVCDNPNEGATTVITTTGELRSPKGFVSPFAATLPDNNVVTNTISNYDAMQNYDLHIGVACNTSNAANLIQLWRGKLYGER